MTCAHCLEEIKPGERADNKGSDFHRECIFRAFVGSVGHLKKTCHCYGGTEEDPPGLTTRQAARAAFELHQKLTNESN